MTSGGGPGVGVGRWLLPATIAVAAAAALFLAVARRDSHGPAVKPPPRDTALGRAETADHVERLAEVHRKERLTPIPLEEQGRLIDEAKDLSAEEKAKRKREWQNLMDAAAEADAKALEIRRDVKDYVDTQRKRLQETPEKEKPKATLRLGVDMASSAVLPGQSIIANVILANDGEDAALRTSLHPRGGYLRAFVRAPGAQDFAAVPFSFLAARASIPEDKAPTLRAGGRWTVQTDLALGLGVNRSGAAVPGAYTVRLQLDILGRDPVASDEFTVRVDAPAGPDETVFKEVAAGGLFSFLGPGAWGKGGTPKGGFAAGATAAESLVRRFPESRYAPDLRVGFVLAALELVDQLAPSPEARVELDRRLGVMCREMVEKDGPRSWPRAEIYLLAAQCAIRLKDTPFPKQEMLDRFRALCPTDIRNGF